MPDGMRLWDEATAACRATTLLGMDLRVSGRLAGQRVLGVRFAVAVDGDRVAIEARAAGGAAPLFSLRGTDDTATLVLNRDRRYVTAPVKDLLDTLVGLPMDVGRLLAVLTGCVSRAAATEVHTVGGAVRVRTSDADVYLTRRTGTWQVRAGVFGDFVADYDRDNGLWPTGIRVTTVAGRSPEVLLSLRVEATDTRRRDVRVFAAAPPAGLSEESVQWLRNNGPFANVLAEPGRP